MAGDKLSDTSSMKETKEKSAPDIQRRLSEERKIPRGSSSFDLPIQIKRKREDVTSRSGSESESESESEAKSENLEQGKRRKTQDSGVAQSSDDLWKYAKTFMESQEKGNEAFQALELTKNRGQLSPELKSQWEDFAQKTQNSPNFEVNFRSFTKHVARFAENAHQVNKILTDMDTLLTDAPEAPNQQEQLGKKFGEMQTHYDTWYLSDISIETFRVKIPLSSTITEQKDIDEIRDSIIKKRDNSNFRTISNEISSFSNEKSRENFESLRKAWDSLSPLDLPYQQTTTSVSSEELWNDRKAFIQNVGEHHNTYEAYKSFASLKSMKEKGQLPSGLKSQWENFAREAHTNPLYQKRLGRFTASLLGTVEKKNQIDKIFNEMKPLFNQNTDRSEKSEKIEASYDEMMDHYNAWEQSTMNIEGTQRSVKDAKIASSVRLRMDVTEEVSQEFEEHTKEFTKAYESFSKEMNAKNFEVLRTQWDAIKSPDWLDRSDSNRSL